MQPGQERAGSKNQPLSRSSGTAETKATGSEEIGVAEAANGDRGAGFCQSETAAAIQEMDHARFGKG